VKDIIIFLISLILTLAVLNILKLSFVPGFILGSILWSLLHFNLKKILKGIK